MNIQLKFEDKVMMTATVENEYGAVTITFINPIVSATINEWLAEESYTFSHAPEGSGIAGSTNGLDDVRAFEQRLLSLTNELGDGWTFEVTEPAGNLLARHMQEQAVEKGGAGSGSWGGTGQPRFAWSPIAGQPATGATVSVPATIPNAPAFMAANAYLKNKGMKEIGEREKVIVDPERGQRIAEAYEKMKSDPNDANVKAAYKALGEEVQAQYDMLPVKIEWTAADPYASSKEMMADVLQNGNLKVFTGGAPHPLLSEKDENGISLNDKFRAVHDYFGHSMRGNQFGPNGEENAWVDHSQMFSTLAQKAMTTETRGQNSWFNFSKTNAGKPPKERQFAEQKVGILPDEFLPTAIKKSDVPVAQEPIAEETDSPSFCPLHHRTYITKGGSGSGNFGHAGRVGEVGGSGAGNDGGKPDIGHETPQTSIPDNMKTFGGVKDYLSQGTKVILSAERPHFKPDDNARRNIGLKRLLQNFSEDVVSQEGTWGGNRETSYVATVSTEDLATIRSIAFDRKELDQDAIIVLRDGKATLEYRDGKTMTGTIAALNDSAGKKDNFSQIGDVKYHITFKDKE